MKQHILPGFQGYGRRRALPAREDAIINGRVIASKRFLDVMHLDVSLIVDVLLYPEHHWERRQKQTGEKVRTIYMPSPHLAELQERIVKYLAGRSAYRSWSADGGLTPAQGYRQRTSIITNARIHSRNRSSWCLDLRSAFEQVRTKHIRRVLLRMGFPYQRSYGKTSSTYSPHVAWLFSRLVTYRGRLRQGSPASPFFFDLAMERVDLAIADALGMPTVSWEGRANPRNYRADFGKLERGLPYVQRKMTNDEQREHRKTCDVCTHIYEPYLGSLYTRYGDDLCFSSPEDYFPESLKATVSRVLEEHGLILNRHKERVGKCGILYFPGVRIVSGRIEPDLKYLRRVAKEYASGRVEGKVLKGHLDYLRMFPRGGRHQAYRKLQQMGVYLRRDR